eukprot:Selendium_serpulae@DN6342_c1_g2_i2.p1
MDGSPSLTHSLTASLCVCCTVDRPTDRSTDRATCRRSQHVRGYRNNGSPPALRPSGDSDMGGLAARQIGDKFFLKPFTHMMTTEAFRRPLDAAPFGFVEKLTDRQN